MNLSPRDITDRKVRAVNLMVVLASRRELRRPTPNQVYEDSQDAPDALWEVKSGCSIVKEVEEIPLVLEKTQWIYCIGNLSYQQRTFRFSRVSHMMDHVAKVHLRREPARAIFVCHHPQCKPLGNFLTSLDHFKSHVQKVHGVKLRK